MDLFGFFDRGVKRSGSMAILARPNADQRALRRAVVNARKEWLAALLVDETAAWLSSYEQRPDVLRGLCVVLSLAALCKEHDDGHLNSPEVRVIRGALSAVEQAGAAGNVITPELTRSLSIAARWAREVINECSDGAIAEACERLNEMTRLGALAQQRS